MEAVILTKQKLFARRLDLSWKDLNMLGMSKQCDKSVFS